ncbi:ABC transporter substrate-binding protein [Deinococcus aquiradiocola]|uniref:ABC transporter substrate-binding protein n=1 Tax=Deinococcus aquiradiocola TaxID=393059 RepID=A0A917URF6_9DEIO|nr:extracellular solute-binding protein [Deinococcus aquiradiocola]GGJ79024.1 ABC transporter substrate-binding protein [Deinococcus aquiradiocola]
MKRMTLLSTLALSLLASSASAATEIEFFVGNKGVDTWKQLFSQFEKQNPDIKVNLVVPPDFVAVLKTRIVKNKTPDIVAMGGDTNFKGFAEGGVFKDYASDALIRKVKPIYVQQLQSIVGGKEVYGIPYTANTIGLIYNVDKLKALGVQPPTTYSAFIAALKKAKAAGQTPLTLTLKDAWVTLPFMNAIAVNTVPATFAAQETAGKTTFQKAYSGVADKMLEIASYSQADPLGTSYPDGTASFARGNSVFYIQGDWALPDILAANPGAKVAMVPFPATDARNKVVSSVDLLLASSASTRHPAEVAKLMAFLTTPQNAVTFQKAVNAPSVQIGTVPTDARLAAMKSSYASGNIEGAPFNLFPPGLSAETFWQAMLQDKNKQKALQGLDKTWADVLKRSN